MTPAGTPEIEDAQILAIAALGFNLHQQGRADEAARIFSGLVAIDPEGYLGYAGLGALALSKQPPEVDEAVQNLATASRLGPADPTVHANYGEALLRQAKFPEAAGEFRQALDLDPEGRDPGANRARAIIEGMDRVIRELETRAGAAQ